MVNWEKIGLPFLNFRTSLYVRKMREAVRPYAKKIATADKSKIKPISGTFICPLPPDYEGILATSWSVEEWKSEFQRLLKLGIDTAIVQSTVTEKAEDTWYIYYPISNSTLKEIQSISQRLKVAPKMEPHVVPAILDAAQATGMKIHLGLYFCIKGWFGVSSKEFLKQHQTEEIAIAKDLIHLYGNHPALAGWYISPEILYKLHGLKLNADMQEFLAGITRILKENTPHLPIGISPVSPVPKKGDDTIINFWKKTLDGAGVDLLYPQDAIGQLVNYPDNIEEMWQFMYSVAQETGVKLWANVESFERRSFNMPNPFEAATFERLHYQLAMASPYVDKIVSWECMFFLNSNGAVDGDKLEHDYKQYFGL